MVCGPAGAAEFRRDVLPPGSGGEHEPNDPDHDAMADSGDNAVEVFLVDAGLTATLSGLTLSGGVTNQSGGGISNAILPGSART